MSKNEVFHRGELELQELLGSKIPVAHAQSVIRPEIMSGSIEFVQSQPYFFVSSMDVQNDIWISILMGVKEYVTIPSLSFFQLDLSKVLSTKKDIFYQNIQDNKEVGSLFIELATRRRYRINTEIRMKDNLIYAYVKEAYPNCPKYIQQRFVKVNPVNTDLQTIIEKGEKLTPSLSKWIRTSDTFFVGSRSNDGRMDASHRGGKEGFIQLEGNTLRIPDYPGNNLYNTLGNFRVNNRAGLLFIDYKTGATLQLTGNVEIELSNTSEEDLAITGGTGRYWIFNTKKWIHTQGHHKAEWQFIEASPFNP